MRRMYTDKQIKEIVKKEQYEPLVYHLTTDKYGSVVIPCGFRENSELYYNNFITAQIGVKLSGYYSTSAIVDEYHQGIEIKRKATPDSPEVTYELTLSRQDHYENFKVVSELTLSIRGVDADNYANSPITVEVFRI